VLTQGFPLTSGSAEAVIIIKAAPQVGKRHGETVCCAAIDLHGNWMRLYPISFRTLDQGQKFKRWDRVRFKYRTPPDDHRTESRRVEQQSIEIVGQLKPAEREKFLGRSVVTGLDKERQSGRSLALLKPEITKFWIDPKPEDELRDERDQFRAAKDQADMFMKAVLPYEPCPFQFRYRYHTDDGIREGTCQDWEIEATYYKWARVYGQTQALQKISQTFGIDLPRKGVLFAMGTHSRWPETWLINGVIRLDHIRQLSLV
jgi:hypothetical protein